MSSGPASWYAEKSKRPFYHQGLRFSCTRCSACCRYESGFVFLSKKDVDILAETLQMAYNEVIETYCQWVPGGIGEERLSLKETAVYDCIFWRQGCSVYEGRPLQCKTFPFWPSLLASRDAWNHGAASCPGMRSGVLHTKDEIEQWISRRRGEPLIVRTV
ncbi:MAG: YkgJ family cysteine cluster protein [Spirochaetaceae bacterium]|jgi:Fe-S-cluster containining protein|nr:YkgJ family cysteine cluster protein [Spirochaetaceae bacterium]